MPGVLNLLLAQKPASGGGGGNPVYVQSAQAEDVTGAVSSKAFGSITLGAGNLVVVMARCGGTTGTVSVSDTAGHTWTGGSGNMAVTSGTDHRSRMFYAKNTTAGATTITVSNGGTNCTFRDAVVEYSGCSTTSPLDQNPAGATGTGTTPTATSLTPTGTNSVVVAWFSFDNNSNVTFGTSYNERQGVPLVNAARGYLEDRIVTDTSAYAAPITVTLSVPWTALAANFK